MAQKDASPSGRSAGLEDLPEWDLTDLYPGRASAEFKNDLERAARMAEDFAARHRGRIVQISGAADAGERLGRAIGEYEVLEELLGRIASYASLSYTANMTEPAIAKFHGDTQERLTEISTELLFFELELNRVEDAALDKALEDPALARYRSWLRDLRAARPYQLNDDLERLFHEKSITGRASWNRLFEETIASLRFEVQGEPLTIEPALHKLLNPDRAVRREAGEALAHTFAQNIRPFTLVTNTLAKDKEIEDRWRGFEDMADSRHLANRVEREVVEALAQAVTDAYPELSHRYYTFKARWLGLEKLEYWDRNAPLPDEEDMTIGWAEARETVLDAYRNFSPRMAEIAQRFFDRSWIDAPVRDGKAPGAFSHPGVPSVHPYVLLNYQGRPRDVATLAHELGHGVHQVLAASQGALMAQTPLTLAETASVFGEMLTFRSLLDKAPSPKARKVLLAAKVEDMINTVVRQIAFYEFERRVHGSRRAYGELTSEKLGEIWLEVQTESLGPAFHLAEGYKTFWCYIPHFIHTPFYVYAYAFGDCLVNALYAVYEEAHEGFAERYLEMLRAGGTLRHRELLAPFGLDASDPAFWSKGLSLMSRLIDELESPTGAGT